MKKGLFKRVAATIILLTLSLANTTLPKVYAEDAYTGPMVGFMMSPMTEKLTLKPGDTHSGSFWIMNPEENTVSIEYSLKVQSFYRDENGKAVFEDVDGRGQLAKWTTLDTPDSSTLAPGDSEEIRYTIKVPYNVPAGGQYAAITATSVSHDVNKPNSAALKESVAMAHTIFAEVEGQTIRSGEISNLNSSSFLLDGNITVSSVVANTGNVHGTASYTLEVYPLFSSEPIYSNVEDPEKKLILPDRKFAHETTYENTPAFGIFNIVYTVKFEGGIEKELKKLVIKTPVWLVFITLIIISSLIVFIIYKLRSRHHHRRQTQETE